MTRLCVPPPESIWARSDGEDGEDEPLEHEVDDFFIEGAFGGGDDEDCTLMIPWFESVDAVVATFPAALEESPRPPTRPDWTHG